MAVIFLTSMYLLHLHILNNLWKTLHLNDSNQLSTAKARVYSESVIVIEPIAHVFAPMSRDVMIEIIAIEYKLNINVFVFNLLEPVVHACESGGYVIPAHESMHWASNLYQMFSSPIVLNFLNVFLILYNVSV